MRVSKDLKGPNFTLNRETVLRDAYRLVTLCMADRVFADYVEREQLMGLREEFIEDELVHLLISTAIANRMHDTAIRTRNGNGPKSLPNCGSLWDEVGEDDGPPEPLSLREACNKVIHTNTIIAIQTGEQRGDFGPMSYEILLSGERGDRRWRAVVNLIEYTVATVENFRRRL